jgi:hypothetical protein
LAGLELPIADADAIEVRSHESLQATLRDRDFSTSDSQLQTLQITALASSYLKLRTAAISRLNMYRLPGQRYVDRRGYRTYT